MTIDEIKFEAEMQKRYSQMTHREKVYLSRKLAKDGFIRGNKITMAEWWLGMKTYDFNNLPSVKMAVDDYIERHPELIYLEDFDPNVLSKYRNIGPAKIKELQGVINMFLQKNERV